MRVTKDMVKSDCILFNSKKVECNGLNVLQCVNGGKCGFYKSNKQYHSNGEKKKYPVIEEE